MILGWLSRKEVETISELSKQVPESGTIVEVGSFCGKSAIAWAKNTTATVYCIDTFFNAFKIEHTISDEDCIKNEFPRNGSTINVEQEFIINTKEYHNIKMIKGFSPCEISYSGDLIDLFFLDALHHNPDDWNNLEFFIKYLKPNAKICGHDNSAEFPDVVDNIKKLEQMFNTKVITFPETSLWMIQT